MLFAMLLSKPHYIYRPGQVLRRLKPPRQAEPVVPTPWGCEMRVSMHEQIGSGIARMGVHELAVSEVMWRLADGLAVDVGAHVGYFTGLLATRAQRVVAFEPNPDLHRLIEENAGRWAGAKVTVDRRAVSNVTGVATLHVPRGAGNDGLATLEAGSGDDEQVETVRLDDAIDGEISVLKIDVEGHELAVLEGLGELRVRNVIFEELEGLPSPVSAWLEDRGFRIYGIEQRLRGPRLTDPLRTSAGWDAPTYLASVDDVESVISPRGWRCLRG
jgi:FkbM family methyltransferase